MILRRPQILSCLLVTLRGSQPGDGEAFERHARTAVAVVVIRRYRFAYGNH